MPEFEHFEGREIDCWGFTRREHAEFREAVMRSDANAELLTLEVVGTGGPRVCYAESVMRTPDGRKHTSLQIMRQTNAGRWIQAFRAPLARLRDLTDACHEIRRRNRERREVEEAEAAE